MERTENVSFVPPWYQRAEFYKGITENDNPVKIIEFLKTCTNLSSTDLKVSTSWCAAFVNYCLGRNGTAWARDYQRFGTKLSSPLTYCIMGFERNGPGGDSHVGFWTGKETSTHYLILGGNQSDSVNESWYAKKDFLYARWPE